MEELWSSQCTFYGLGDFYTGFVGIRFKFDSVIDKNVMQKALDTTITRYPYFRVKMVRVGEEIALEKNSEPMLLYDDPDDPSLSNNRNLGHLLRVSAKGQWLNICFCHALTDGRGIMPFVKTLFHYYWQTIDGTDIGIVGVHLAGEEIPESETNDPVVDFSGVEPPKNQGQPPIEPFRLPVEKDASCALHIHCFSIGTKPFMKFSHDVDGSPNAIVAMLMSRAIRSIHPQADNIVAGVAVDHRRAIGCESYHCRVGLLPIRYQPKMDDMDISKCATCYRGIIILQSDDDVIKRKAAASQQFSYYLKSLKTMAEKRAVSQMAIEQGAGGVTFSVSYTGQQDFGGVDRHIVSADVETETLNMHMAIEILCFGEKFHISVSQDFADDVYVRKLIEILESEGISCSDQHEITVPHLSHPEM